MDLFIEKYKNETGRSLSMYVYVLYDCSQDKLREHINKQLDGIEKISDQFKRKLYTSRYTLLKDMVEQNLLILTYNHILFIGDEIGSHQLTDKHKELLRKYDHKNITYIADNHFDLNFVSDLLFNDTPYHIYRVNNNKIDYIQMTKTKKMILNSKESKPLNIPEFISNTLPPNTKYIIYGVSGKLKEINDPKAYAVITKYIKDEELIDMTKQIDQEDDLILLETDLKMMQDMKQVHKVIFKRDIVENIKSAMIQKLYIDAKMYDKFNQMLKKNDLDVNFKLIIIDTSIKSFVDGRESLIDTYGGVVGITYY
jgi:hypothetical protein